MCSSWRTVVMREPTSGFSACRCAEFWQLNNFCLVGVFLNCSAVSLQAYCISVVWSCYKYLIQLGATLPVHETAFVIDTDHYVISDTPDGGVAAFNHLRDGGATAADNEVSALPVATRSTLVIATLWYQMNYKIYVAYPRYTEEHCCRLSVVDTAAAEVRRHPAHATVGWRLPRVDFVSSTSLQRSCPRGKRTRRQLAVFL